MEYELNGADGIGEINILELICLKNVVSGKFLGNTYIKLFLNISNWNEQLLLNILSSL